MLLRDAYQILGVEPGISEEEIRSKYRLLIKELHPDVTTGHGEELGQIIEAYRLIDSRHRIHNRVRAVRRRTTEQQKQPEERKDDAARVITLGRIAVGKGTTASRCNALRHLAHTGLRSAGVFVRQCLFDSDATVALEAARALPQIPGNRMETVLIELFDQLSVAQCQAVIASIARSGGFARLLAFAAADRRFVVRQAALEVLHERG